MLDVYYILMISTASVWVLVKLQLLLDIYDSYSTDICLTFNETLPMSACKAIGKMILCKLLELFIGEG